MSGYYRDSCCENEGPTNTEDVRAERVYTVNLTLKVLAPDAGEAVYQTLRRIGGLEVLRVSALEYEEENW